MPSFSLPPLACGVLVLALASGCGSTDSKTGEKPDACTAGFQTVVTSGSPAPYYGHVAMALDEQGNPELAFIGYDPNGDGDVSDSALYFDAYDPDSCSWKAPVQLDVVGYVDDSRDREVTMARDASTGALLIAYQTIDQLGDQTSEIKLAQSTDNGATWTTEQVARDRATDYATDNTVSRPIVAMRDGKTFLAYFETWILSGSATTDSDAATYHLRSRTGLAGTFSDTLVPKVSGALLPGSESYVPGLAIDSAGNAGFAYVAATDDETYNLQVCYFASNQTASVAVFDSLDTQDDGPEVSLAFDGTKPRIAASLQRGEDDATALWFSASDDGATWGAPIQVPNDGADGMGADLDLKLDAAGDPWIAVHRSSNSGETQCGTPKLSTRTGTADFSTCGPPLDQMPSFNDYDGDFVQLGFTPEGKRVMAFSSTYSRAQNNIVVWRQS